MGKKKKRSRDRRLQRSRTESKSKSRSSERSHYMPKSHDRPRSKLTQYFKPVTEESPQVTSEESTMVNMVFPKSIQAFSLDTGDEIGVTLFRQPPLPPSHPPGTYPPEQMRRWWFGEWADQLGDGRPVMLEEYRNRNAYPDEVKPR